MLILASASPRRRELMNMAGLSCECIPSNAEEVIPEGAAPEEIPAILAGQKAAAVFAAHPGDVVIGSDTVVEIEGRILGKPHTEAEAAEMLRLLSGKTHLVHTGVCIVSEEKKKVFTSTTAVEFYPLTDGEIAAYVATKDPMDKAGAYGIQGPGSYLVKGITGDYYTVMGFPIAEVQRSLRYDFGISGGML